MLKKSAFTLFLLAFSTALTIGCGKSETFYGDGERQGDAVVSDGDSDKSFSDPDATNDFEESDKNDNDSDFELSPDSDDVGASDDDATNETYWETCAGIIACMNSCEDDNTRCQRACYKRGNDNGQNNYKNWRGCYQEFCSKPKDVECSEKFCPEESEICDYSQAVNVEIPTPAPYGSASLSGNFTYILNDSYPSFEEQIVLDGFAKGEISSFSLTQSNRILSYVNKIKRNGTEFLEAVQTSLNSEQKIVNPAVFLRIKKADASCGEHSIGVGVSDESEAELVVVDLKPDSPSEINCYHAFGIGTFTIEEVVVSVGPNGRLKFNGTDVQLFHPKNIPELGGNAVEILGVTPCSLIQ